MEKHFEEQLKDTTGNCMLLYLVEHDGGLFVERHPHHVGRPIKLEGRKFARMHTYNLPVFEAV